MGQMGEKMSRTCECMTISNDRIIIHRRGITQAMTRIPSPPKRVVNP